ncbi:hypothetical protein IJ384_06640 [bacterium]|nr:hypothetical protein [bacterium]
MAIANLHETIQASILRRNQLNLEITELQAQKTLATYSQADLQSLLSSEKHSVRDYFKALFEGDEALQEEYLNYTEIPDFEEEIDRITAQFQEQLDELTAWETAIDAQITTNSAELEEVKAYLESYKGMLSSNIQEDFNFGLNG